MFILSAESVLIDLGQTHTHVGGQKWTQCPNSHGYPSLESGGKALTWFLR